MRYTIMTKRTIKEIKSMLTASPVQEHLLLELQKDSRKGVQQLLRSYERKYKQEQALLALQEEKRQFDAQYKHTNTILAGVDEAGRGPLAGPVTAAAVILPEDFSLPGLTDSKQLNVEGIQTTAMIKGDEQSLVIAAASILAKVKRDQLMKQIDEEYPAYEFSKNKGYGTKTHLKALQEFGPCPSHRKSFAPVSGM